MLAQGNPESFARSGSGTPSSLIDALRNMGIGTAAGNVEPEYAARFALAALTYSPHRSRWRARFHLSTAAFRLRSARATALVERHRTRTVLQYGATFTPRHVGNARLFVYADNNILNSAREPHSWVHYLTSREFTGAIANERRTYAHADRIFCFSDYVRRSFIHDFGIPEERLITVGAGPNLPTASLPHPTEPIRPRPQTTPTILFIGRDFDMKGGRTLYAAFEQVRLAIPGVRLVTIGPTAPPPQEGVEHCGFISKDTPTGLSAIRQAFEHASVFCLPTRYESFGISLVEAMHFGLPVVATGSWAIPEIVEDDVTGLLVPPDDPHRLAQALIRVLTSPDKGREMGVLGRQRALSRFTWPAVAERMRTAMFPSPTIATDESR